MPRHQTVATIMSRNVRTLGVASKISEVRHALIANEIHHMPIVDGDELVGIVSWRDLVRAYRSSRSTDHSNATSIDDLLDQSTTLEEMMTKDLVTLQANDSIDHAIDLIADGHIHSVLVVDTDDRLVGIVTDKNIVAFLSE